MSAVVQQYVQAHLVLSTHRSVPIRVGLRYRAADPLAVRMLFPAEYALDECAPDAGEPAEYAPDRTPVQAGPEIVWVFARQLLAAGLELPSGLGDVHIRPFPGHRVLVELRAPEGVALVRFDALDLRRFLWRSHLAVPQGQERLDPDRALAELLGQD